MILTPKNWSDFQHYKDRSPAWIKLHRGLLDDFDFHCLPVASRALAPILWLLASEYKGGEITASIEEMAFRFRMSVTDLKEAIKPLIDKGFFIASGPLAERTQDAIPEKEREIEEEKRKNADASATALELPSPEVDYFRRVKEICGASAGGLAKKLLDAKDGNIALARAAAEQASTKHDPREYLGGVIRNRGSPEDERIARRSF
jgi:hypothetical protein